MKFTTAAAVEQVVWEMRLADWPRARNRALINALYNGAPPYTEAEARDNRIVTNVNHLEGTKLLHDARRQFETAFNTADPLFTVEVDYGPPHLRGEWGAKITREIGNLVRRSQFYTDVKDSTFASLVLHGVGATIWEDRDHWCPLDYGIEDVLIPSNTLLSMRNLPFFAVYRQYTGMELYRMTHGAKVDPAWNVPLADKLIKWVDQQAAALMSASWPETWSPEKWEERIKQDGGLYMSDAVPTIDTFDFYYWDDSGKQSGWKRKIILDAWGDPGVGGVGGVTPNTPMSAPAAGRDGWKRGDFLYDAGERVYVRKLEEVAHWQFADASAVAPFKYHSVRSLGYLLYAVCHLQNRLRCKFTDATFESLMQFFRVNGPEDAERAIKINLIDKGVIPEGVNFMPQGERWQYNAQLATEALSLNRQTMSDNSASFTQDFDYADGAGRETATRTMAKVNATAALVGAMLNKAYVRQAAQYREMCRRFCQKNSRDPDVRRFRVECLKGGVPVEALNAERWSVDPVRVLGNGNATLQVLMADKLMGIRPQLDPEAQKEVDRIYIRANSGNDSDMANRLVPRKPMVSSSVHDAQIAVASLLAGLPVQMADGQNHREYVQVWLLSLAAKVQMIQQRGGTATPDEINGLVNLAKHTDAQIKKLAQDKNEKARVAAFGKQLGKLMNFVKAFAQRLQQQQKAGAQQRGMDPKDQAKIAATMQVARTKELLAGEKHATKQAQEEIKFQQELKHETQRHRLEMQREAQDLAVERIRSLQA